MTALVRYLLADLVRSQRYLAPVLLYLAVLGVLYGGDPGTPLPVYAASAGMLYPVAGWLTVVVVTTEDAVQRTVTAVTAGGWSRMTTGLVALALLADAVLAVVSVLWPVVASPYHYGWHEVSLGLSAHLVCAMAGTAVGLVCCPPVIRQIGWTVCAMGGVVLLTVLGSRMPPVGAVIQLLARDRPEHEVLVLLGCGVLAALLVAVAGTVSYLVGRRRW